MAPEAERAGAFGEQPLVIRRVRAVARQAPPFAGNGRVRERDGLRVFLVARDADAVPRLLEQGRTCRRMRRMTEQALAVLERQMLHFPRALHAGGVVATRAQLGSGEVHRERLLRRWRHVARAAVRARNGRVHAGLQQAWLRRTVGAVAPGARDPIDGVAAVRLREPWLGGGVTAEAQRLFLLDEEVRLLRSVRRMADGAAVRLDDLVGDLLRVGRLVVALKADLRRFRREQVGGIRGMRVVAQHARPALDGGVDVRLVQPELVLRMAAVTEFVAVLLHDAPGHQAVTQMALVAGVRPDDGMDVLHAQVLARELLVAPAAQAVLPAEALTRGLRVSAERPLLRRLSLGRQRAGAQREDDAQRQRTDRLPSSRHHCPLLRYVSTFDCARSLPAYSSTAFLIFSSYSVFAIASLTSAYGFALGGSTCCTTRT